MTNPLLAHERLTALLEEHGAYEPVLRAAMDAADDPGQIALAAMCRAQLGQATSDDADALEEWECSDDDADLRLAALSCVYYALGDAAALTEVALERRSSVQESPAATALLAHLALALAQLDPDADATTLVCDQAFELAPQHDAAVAAMQRLAEHRATEPAAIYDRLLSRLRRLAETAPRHDTAALQRALGWWASEKLADPVLAESHLTEAFEADSEDDATGRWLLDAWRTSGDRAGVERVLRARFDQSPHDDERANELLQALRDAERWHDWCAAYGTWQSSRDAAAAEQTNAALSGVGEARALEHANILQAHLGASDEALHALDQARARFPDSSAVALAWLAHPLAHDLTERARCTTLVAAGSNDAEQVLRAADAWHAAGDPERAHTLAKSLSTLESLSATSLEKLAIIAEDARAFEDAARVWARHAELSPTNAVRAESFRRAATATRAAGNNPISWYEAAVAADPTRRDLVEALATEARRVDDRVSERAALAALCAMATPETPLAAPWESLAEAETALGHRAAAADAWARALASQHGSAAVARAASSLAELAAAGEDWQFLRPLIPHQALLVGTDDPDLAYALGKCFAESGDFEHARAWLAQVVALAPGHEGALRWLALHGEEESADAIMGLLRATQDSAERLALLLRLARARRNAGEWEDAVAAYELAAEADIGALEPLHHLLSLHMERQHWLLAIDVLGRMEQRAPELAGRLRRTAACLHRDELRDVESAAESFARALQADPRDSESREALVDLLRTTGDHDALATVLADALKLSPDPNTAIELGALLAGPLDRYSDALSVWDAAARDAADPLPLLERIAKTYPKSGKPDAQLIDEHHAVLRAAVDRPDSHYALFAAYKRQRAFDRAWLHASALRVLGDDAKPARDFVAEHRSSALPAVRRPWSDADWDAVLGGLTSAATWSYINALGHWLQRATARVPADWGLDAHRDVRAADALGEVGLVLQYGATVLGLASPAVWASREHAGVMNAGALSGALVLGPQIIASGADASTAFRLLRGLALLHPRLRAVACVAHPESLAALAEAAHLLHNGQPAANPAVRRWLDGLRREHPDVLRGLGQATASFEAAGGHHEQATTWPAIVEQAACSVALTLTGNLSQAVDAVSREPAFLGGEALSDRLLDVLRFWSSDAHAHLRAELGIGVGQR